MSEKESKSFGSNPFGITNDEGQSVTLAYISRYVQCWCRKADGYGTGPGQVRSEILEHFESESFLKSMTGKTASQIGKEACLSDLWDTATYHPRRNKACTAEWEARHKRSTKVAVVETEEQKAARLVREAIARLDATFAGRDAKKFATIMRMDRSMLPDGVVAIIVQVENDLTLASKRIEDYYIKATK